MAALAVVILLFAGRNNRGFWTALVAFSVIGAGPPLLRALHKRFRQARFFGVLASFWLLPSAALAHANMGPIVDSVNPVVLDRYLALGDLSLFGVHPAVALEAYVPPLVNELLLLCYYSYFLWPVALGVILYRRRDRRAYHEYTLALCLLFAANFLCYALVPAIGPRLYLADHFEAPLQGVWLTPLLDSLMRNPCFMRDCFPSGHTAVTATVMVFAWRHERRFFKWVMPIAVGLVTATVLGRFHYVVDLMAAVPLLMLSVSAAGALHRVRPRGLVLVAKPALAVREPVRA
jgi:hypothetical protein